MKYSKERLRGDGKECVKIIFEKVVLHRVGFGLKQG